MMKRLKKMILNKFISKEGYLSFNIQSKLNNGLKKSNVSGTIIEEGMSIDEIIEDAKSSPNSIDSETCRNAEPGSELAEKINIALNGSKKG